jgi:ADP-heptose:LPS heptosyltransferase
MKYLSVASRLMREGYEVAVIGGPAEQDVIEKMTRLSPRIHDLCGRTTLFDLASLVQDAALVVGNDTGPTHLAAMCGCPTIALFSGASDPVKSAPVGPKVTVIQSDPIDGITVDDVMKQVFA